MRKVAISKRKRMEQRYESVFFLVKSTAATFARRYNCSFQDCLSEANKCFVEAFLSYTKDKSKFSTWIRNKIWYGLMTWRRESSKYLSRNKQTVFLDDDVPQSSSFSLQAFVEDLSDDARKAVELAVFPTKDMEREFKKNKRNQLWGMRKIIRRKLHKEFGWRHKRIDRAFKEVREALR